MSRFTKIFTGKVDDSGTLIVDQTDKLSKWLHFLSGNDVEITVKKPVKRRSSGQNGYYWGVVVDKISEAMGLTPDETHEFLKRKFLKEDVTVDGKVYHLTRDSSSINTVEWEDFMKNCRVWASHEFGLWIPKPNEVVRDDIM